MYSAASGWERLNKCCVRLARHNRKDHGLFDEGRRTVCELKDRRDAGNEEGRSAETAWPGCIVTYILRFNNIAAGNQGLQPDINVLKQIVISVP
jgi:hypothetical protein